MTSWDDVRVFLAVARGGSLLDAAHELGIDQTTVSRRLKRYERQVGAVLFHTEGGKRHLTPMGDELRTHALNVERSLSTMQAVALGAHQAPAGIVKLSLPSALARFMIVPKIHLLQALYPEISIDFDTSENFADLSRLEADIALRLQRPTSGDFAMKRVGTFSSSVYVSKTARDDVSWAVFSGRLANVPEVEWINAQLMGKKPLVRFADASLFLEAIKSGAVAGLLPVKVAENEPDLHRLPAAPITSREVWLLTRFEMKDAPHIKAVTHWLSACFDPSTNQ